MSLKRSLSLRGRALLLLKSAKRRATAKGLEYSLNLDWIMLRLTAGRCEATGVEFDLSAPQVGHTINPWSPSLHREDITRGYTPTNTFLVCSAFNVARGQWSKEVFDKLIFNYMENEVGSDISENT